MIEFAERCFHTVRTVGTILKENIQELEIIMSDVESYTGKLVPVEMHGLTLEEKCQELCTADTLPSYTESWLEELYDEYYKQYHYSAALDTLFVVEKEPFDPESVLQMEQQEDGTYSFMVSFYNGGASLNEMLEDGLHETQSE